MVVGRGEVVPCWGNNQNSLWLGPLHPCPPPDTHLSMHLSIIYAHIHPYTSVPVQAPLHPSMHPSLKSTCTSIQAPIHVSLCPPMYPSIHLCIQQTLIHYVRHTCLLLTWSLSSMHDHWPLPPFGNILFSWRPWQRTLLVLVLPFWSLHAENCIYSSSPQIAFLLDFVFFLVNGSTISSCLSWESFRFKESIGYVSLLLTFCMSPGHVNSVSKCMSNLPTSHH